MTPMAEQWPAASEASAARTVFGPLGGIEDVFRMWRVRFLAEVLMPSSSSPEGMREGFRVYAHALERTLSQPWGRR
ncbi:hypothetical protein [Streptomyces sp. AM8-1-1]|uniref:hypothetical protein n=1 Tax=Streptomyces sp. AM8-1-1 TaxID=3075825 RepID=UPI0028C3F273|nr:hypothetical protein [Streptomyces sp. AM8-1-1]WNO73996.1 hypothetical protein RPQ07_21255 [Streptomyces sp. AM8-1-1]